MFFSFLFLFSFNSFAQTVFSADNCNSNSIDELYSLIYSQLEPFDPPASVLDDDGNITASEDELFSLRRRHFYDQLKGEEVLSINLHTYAIINKELPNALKYYKEALSIPIFYDLSYNNQKNIINIFKDIIE